MRRSILLVLATLIAFGSAPSFAISDRNNEPSCAQPGAVDPRCF